MQIQNNTSQALDMYKQNTSTSTKTKEKSAKNDSLAQLQLAVSYRNGRIASEQNFELGLEWLIKSAEQGNIDAQSYLGHSYLTGQGVEKNYVKALKWLTEAANGGHSDAQYHLGMMYFTGTGVQENKKIAKVWLKKAVQQGNEMALIFYPNNE
jgi:TPR repeat protein